MFAVLRFAMDEMSRDDRYARQGKGPLVFVMNGC